MLARQTLLEDEISARRKMRERRDEWQGYPTDTTPTLSKQDTYNEGGSAQSNDCM